MSDVKVGPRSGKVEVGSEINTVSYRRREAAKPDQYKEQTKKTQIASTVNNVDQSIGARKGVEKTNSTISELLDQLSIDGLNEVSVEVARWVPCTEGCTDRCTIGKCQEVV